MLAKAIAILPFAASVFSATASQGLTVARIIKGTGSTLKPADLALYQRLVSNTDHVQATLQMMAQWQLEPLLARLPQQTSKALLIATERDAAVPPRTSTNAAERMPNAKAIRLPHLGHLAHEEDADTIAPHILDALMPNTRARK